MTTLNETKTAPHIATKRYIIEAFIIATVITGGLTLIAQLFTEAKFNIFETLSVYFSFACTWLCTRQVRFNYVIGVISTALLSITFWQAHLYGSMALNLYLIPTVIYGWFIWGKDTDPRPVEHVKPSRLLIYGIITAATWVGAYFTITKLGGELVALDGWMLIGSILAQFLMDRKKIESWIVWVMVNIASIYVYFHSGLYLLAAQFAFFLANSMFAYFAWKKTMNKIGTDEGLLLATSVATTPTIADEVSSK